MHECKVVPDASGWWARVHESINEEPGSCAWYYIEHFDGSPSTKGFFGLRAPGGHGLRINADNEALWWGPVKPAFRRCPA